MRERVSIKCKQKMISNPVQNSNARVFIKLVGLSFFLFLPFLGKEKNVYTPNQGTNREKYFDHIIYKRKC